MDLFTKCHNFEDAVVAREAGTYPYFIPLDRSEGTEVVFEGRRIIMCGSNNYLGLTTHPKVRQAAKDAIDLYGTSCTGSRLKSSRVTKPSSSKAWPGSCTSTTLFMAALLSGLK